MTKEETKQRIAVMQAYVDGKQIQVYETSLGKWFDTDAPSWITSKRFRIKSEPHYRPFRNAEECWQEMLKHVPFGWVRTNSHGFYKHINNLLANTISFQESEIAESGNFEWCLSDLFKSTTFADGTPFGIKED